jgi:hypothetical protein
MSYSPKQTKIEDLRRILFLYQTDDAKYEIYSNRAKAPYTVLIKVGKDFRDHKELQRWDSNWKAYKDMTSPGWHPERPLIDASFMFKNLSVGASIKGLAREDLMQLLALQDRRHLWGLKDLAFEISKLRKVIKQLK